MEEYNVFALAKVLGLLFDSASIKQKVLVIYVRKMFTAYLENETGISAKTEKKFELVMQLITKIDLIFDSVVCYFGHQFAVDCKEQLLKIQWLMQVCQNRIAALTAEALVQDATLKRDYQRQLHDTFLRMNELVCLKIEFSDGYYGESLSDTTPLRSLFTIQFDSNQIKEFYT